MGSDAHIHARRGCTALARRRLLALAIGTVFASFAASIHGQQPGRVPVVGLLFVSTLPDDPIIVALRERLRELGYVDGKNVRIEYRSALGKVEILPRLADELVRVHCDVIVTAAEHALRAALRATKQIPIVLVAFDYDPVTEGLVSSLNRPGGNITGIYARQTEMVGKRLELLKELVPGLKRIAVFWDVSGKGQLEEIKRAAQALGVRAYFIELSPPYDFNEAFSAAMSKRPQALMVLYSPVFYVASPKIAALALEHHLPTMYQWKAGPHGGGLISYGADDTGTYGHAAYFIDRLLRGARPSDLPIEQASTFTLAVNLQTAKALGVVVPESILLRANDIIR